ncbi:MAG: hypothetical protein ABH827_00230 [bacterium]
MISKQFRKLLLLAAVFGLASFNAQAFEWKPVGSEVTTVDGIDYANTSSDIATYAQSDYIYNTTEGVLRDYSKINIASSFNVVSKTLNDSKAIFTKAKPKTSAKRGKKVIIESNTEFAATTIDNTLNIYGVLYPDHDEESTPVLDGDGHTISCPLKIDGDVTLEAIDANMTINVVADIDNPTTYIMPYVNPYPANPDLDGWGHAQVHFNVAEGKNITVNVNNSLEFSGINPGLTTRSKTIHGTKILNPSRAPLPAIDMILTFAGKGQTIFKMASGVAIKFLGEIDGTSYVDMTDGDSFTGVGNSMAGTKVFITMEQTEADVTNGINKVVFQHATGTDQRNIVVVGNNSIITYVSNDDTGIKHLPKTEDPEFVPDLNNFASLAFDPSNTGSGRMVLFILGAYLLGFQDGYTIDDAEYEQMTARFPFNDGAVIVQGHYVAGYTPAEIRESLDYSYPAGGQAFLRTVDDVTYNNTTTKPYVVDPTTRRGLLVINDAQSVTKRASDPYLDYFNTTPGEETIAQKRSTGREPSELYGYNWCYSNPANYQTIVRNGFVLGVNGKLDIYHNTFFDYVAGSINRTDLLAQNDFNETADLPELTSLATIMKKNPAAFVVDGLDANLFDRIDPSLSLSSFTAANPALLNRHAQVALRGNGTALFRCSGSSTYGYIYNFWKDYIPYPDGEIPGELIYPMNPIDDPDFDYQLGLMVDDTNFDGYRLKDGDHTTQDGQHVVEVEGLLDVTSVSNTTIIDPTTLAPRSYATDSIVDKAGIVNMPTILLDYMGNEVATRPLTISALPEYSYMRYNSPAMFFNNHASFYDTNIVHSDVTKMIDGVPASSYPAMLGGERMYFADKRITYDGVDPDRYRFPEVRLYTSMLQLQESLNTSGIRFVVRDITGAVAVTPEVSPGNQSVIKFFDHGNTNDTDFKGFGRALMFGSYKNMMADNSTNWVTEGSYLNIFRKHGFIPAVGITASVIDVSLQNGNQFPTNGFTDEEYAAQRAHHLILMSTMEKGAANIAIGWPTTSGDSAEGYPYENTLYGDKLIKEVLSEDAANRFDLDAVAGVKQARLIIDGKYMVFSGFDRNGNCTATPIERMDESGKVYVNHGGKITITDTNTAIVETIIAQKAWNDYNYDGTNRVVEYSGRVDLPTDQVKFLVNAAVQPYGFTPEMLAYRSDETDGYVRLSFNNNDTRTGLTAKFDQTGAEEVVINWFNRAGDNREFAPGDRRFSFPTTRATQNITAPIAKPTSLLYIGSGDDIAQMRVAGATQSNKFQLDISGDEILPAPGHVREFTSASRQVDMPTDHFVGEGDNAVLFLEYGGRIGLGSRDWDSHSGGNSWTILGQDHVQIVPLGDGTIDLNSDIIIADKNAIVCSTMFSADTKANRITFRSDMPHKIVIPAGGELDLSSFGQATNRQEIAFGGKVSLVIEAGATIRFPAASSVVGGVVLYFNDESELIFQEGSEAQTVTQAFETAAKADVERIKIVGKGQIWTNKDAQIMVNGNVLVGVQSDTQTPITDVTISLQRESAFNIGTPTVSGGAFQVGNPVEITDAAVNFSLILGDINSKFHIDRLGFFGLGAGVIDKFNKINGAATAAGTVNVSGNPVVDADGKAVLGEDGLPMFTGVDAPVTAAKSPWTIQALYNVGQITLDLKSGQFEHNNIADGSSANGSLMAVGPSSRNGTDNYVVKVNGPLYTTVRGGGNIMKVPTLGTIYNANVWDYAGALANGEAYSILPSAALIIDRAIAADLSTATNYIYNGAYYGGKVFTYSTLDQFFNLLSFKTIKDQPRKKVCWGTEGFDVIAGFVNADVNALVYPATMNVIRRLDSPVIKEGSVRTPLNVGTAIARSDLDIDPSAFGTMEVA